QAALEVPRVARSFQCLGLARTSALVAVEQDSGPGAPQYRVRKSRQLRNDQPCTGLEHPTSRLARSQTKGSHFQAGDWLLRGFLRTASDPGRAERIAGQPALAPRKEATSRGTPARN